MGRHAQTDRAKPGGDQIWNDGLFGQHQGQGTGPAALHQNPRPLVNPRRVARDGADLGNMHNQRIERRALLDGKDLGHSAFIQGVSPETVDGFGRKGDHAAGL